MTEIGERIIDLLKQGKTIPQIMRLCKVGSFAVQKYRAIYRGEYSDELGKKIMDLTKQGKTVPQIMDLCKVGKYTVQMCRAVYREKHEDELALPEGWMPKVTEKEIRLRKEAVTAQKIDQIRAEIRVGDKIPLQSLKIAEMVFGTEPANGRKTTGIVVSTSNRRFCIVELSNGAKECVLWADLVTQRRVQKEVEGKKA